MHWSIAMVPLEKLEPVRLSCKLEPEEENLGFIAEDIPDLVATNSCKTIATMGIVLVITQVVKDQQNVIDRQGSELKSQRQLLEQMSAQLKAWEARLEQ